MDGMLGLGSSKSSSRSASPGRTMISGGSKSTVPTRSSDHVSSAGPSFVTSRHRRKSPEFREEAILAKHGSDEYDDTDFLHSSSHLSNGSSEQVATIDDPDSHISAELARQRAAIEHIQKKISRTKELIKEEQTTRDDNVNEYLKLATSADKQQVQRIKSVFEKKNQKSAQIISQLQKKLDSYNKRIRDIETQRINATHRQPREVLRDMGLGLKNVGGNIRDGISGFSGGVVENIKGGLHGAAESVMSKPREFAHLIKNKFGSADNINSLSRNGENVGGDEEKVHHGSATLPGNCSLSSHNTSAVAAGKFPSDEGSPCSSVTSESLPNRQQTSPHVPATALNLGPIFTELQERREEIEMLKEKVEALKYVQQNVQQEMQYLGVAIQEERFRSERLEEQVNDLTELHQNEVENLKQTLTDMEEKVQYQSEERLRDIHEMLESCQTKISKMEHQQAQHQQYVTLEGIDNSNARALVVKLINILLTVLQVVLLLVATGAGIIMPFLKTRLRMLSTVIVIAALVFSLKQWPELQDVGAHLVRRIKEGLTVK